MARAVLALRLGAIGDLAFTLAGLQALKKHHPDVPFFLLTRKPHDKLAQSFGLFDRIIAHPYPRLGRFGCHLYDWHAIKKTLRQYDFSHIYDFQATKSTRPALLRHKEGLYYSLNPYDQAFSADAPAHPLSRIQGFLQEQGIRAELLPDMAWLSSQKEQSSHLPKGNFALLIPGATAWRRNKIWPHFANIAEWLWTKNSIRSVILGGRAEKIYAHAIKVRCPEAVDLTGEISLVEGAILAKHALFTLGNDTGLAHLVALSGYKSFIMVRTKIWHYLKTVSLPELSFIQASDVRTIAPERVTAELNRIL